MTVSYMDFTPRNGAYRPGLFALSTRDALAQLLAVEHPQPGRRKTIMQKYGVTEDEARSACNASASAQTLEKFFDVGGWPLTLKVYAIRFGEGVDQHIQRERARHEEQAARLAALARAVRPLGSVGDPGPSDLAPIERGRASDRSRRVGEEKGR